MHDVPKLLAAKKRQGIDERDSPYSLGHQLRSPTQHHAPRARADHCDVGETFSDQQSRYLGAVGLGRDPGAEMLAPVAAAIQRWTVHLVTSGGEPLANMLPDPTALVGAVQEYEGCHGFLSL